MDDHHKYLAVPKDEPLNADNDNTSTSSSDDATTSKDRLIRNSKPHRKRNQSGQSKHSDTGHHQPVTIDPVMAKEDDVVLDVPQGIREAGYNINTPINDGDLSSDNSSSSRDTISPTRKYIGVAVLFFINLLNYMDRYTIAGVLTQITDYFNISNAEAGLLQTVFIISYMLAAPLFGYLGDRYNRKLIMVIGLVLWSGFTFVASFVNNPQWFWAFLSLRGLVGIGEASYSTISPTMIADMFSNQQRSRMLTIFYFAIPLGSGLGYIVGAKAAQLAGSWQWALRVTPALGLLSVVLLIFACPNPERGASETTETSRLQEKTKYIDDLKYLAKNKSFILVTIGFTMMAFVIGSLTLWGPVFFINASVVIGNIPPCTDSHCDGNVSFIFGVITCLAGVFGVWIGAEWASRWKARGQANADALVCSIANFMAVPFLMIAVSVAFQSIDLSWAMIFIADLFLCMTWTMVGDMSMYVMMPVRRSTGQAVLILTGHLFGDAGSPALLGVIYDAIEATLPNTYYNRYISLVRAMYVTLFVCAIGGGAFLIASLYLEEDKKKVDDEIKQLNEGSSTSSSCTSSTSIPLNSKLDIVQTTSTTPQKPDLIPNSPLQDETIRDNFNNSEAIDSRRSSEDSPTGDMSSPLLGGRETVI